MKYSAVDLQSFLRAAGWPEEKVVIMAAIGLAESSGDPNARNASGELSIGLWQINIDPRLGRPYREADLKNPLYNAQIALEIYRQQGLRAWGAYTDGSYRRYMPQSQAAYSGGLPSYGDDDNDGPYDTTLDQWAVADAIALQPAFPIGVVVGVVALVVVGVLIAR